MRVRCIDNSGRPNCIPTSKWLVRGATYTVIDSCRCNVQGGLLGYKVEEINLKDCEPYEYFAANRFAPEPDGEDIHEKETYEQELVA